MDEWTHLRIKKKKKEKKIHLVLMNGRRNKKDIEKSPFNLNSYDFVIFNFIVDGKINIDGISKKNFFIRFFIKK